MLSRFSIIVAALALAGHGADAFAATGSLAGLRRATAASATLHKSRGMRMTMVPTAVDKETLKRQILQIAALTDRGQRLNTLVAPVYQASLVVLPLHLALVNACWPDKLNGRRGEDNMTGERSTAAGSPCRKRVTYLRTPLAL